MAPEFRFGGFSPVAIRWFEGLEQDNSKAYFDEHRQVWETEIRDALTALLSELSGEFGGVVKLFRQNRDVRFSSDKRPYKTNTYGILYKREGTEAGLYASLSAKGLWAGTGYYDMAKDQIARYREAVAAPAGETLERQVAKAERAGLEIGGEALTTVPRGYQRDHPRARLLRHTSLVAGLGLEPGEKLASRRARQFVAKTWRAAEPLNGWLDQHVGASTIPPEVRWGRGRG